MTLPVDVEMQREKTKLLESLQAEIAMVDNQALHNTISEKSREITIEERRRVSKLAKELKLIQGHDL
jgi:hypothetical protein